MTSDPAAHPMLRPVGAREARRRRLAALLDAVERGSLRSVRGPEAAELGWLYRECLADLGEAEAAGEDPAVVLESHRLVARAYAVVYRRPGPGVREAARFLAFGFPALLRRRIHAFAAACLVFLAAGIVGLLAPRVDSKVVDLVIPPSLKGSAAERLARTDLSFDELDRAALSSKLMTHNIGVAIRAFAGGVLGGLGTLYALVVNGLLLGGLAAVAREAGRDLAFLALVAPHGALEIPAILVAAAGGFTLGFALVAPGPHRRLEWFGREARDAVALLLGTVPMFILAALLEAWVTPAPLGDEIKLAIAAGVFAATALWLALAGGESGEPAPRSAAG